MKCSSCRVLLTKENSSNYNLSHRVYKCRVCSNKTSKETHKRMKERAFQKLGNKCSNPFNIDHSSFEGNPFYLQVLQIDHINGGGSKQRKLTGHQHFCRAILKGSKDYQLLCPTCNWIKRVVNGEGSI